MHGNQWFISPATVLLIFKWAFRNTVGSHFSSWTHDISRRWEQSGWCLHEIDRCCKSEGTSFYHCFGRPVHRPLKTIPRSSGVDDEISQQETISIFHFASRSANAPEITCPIEISHGNSASSTPARNQESKTSGSRNSSKGRKMVLQRELMGLNCDPWPRKTNTQSEMRQVSS